MSHKSLGKDYSLCKAFSSTTQGRRGLSTWSQARGACLPLPDILLGWFFFFSVTSILNFWLPHTITMRKLHMSQTVWHWCGTWSTRRPRRSTSSTVRYPKPNLAPTPPLKSLWPLFSSLLTLTTPPLSTSCEFTVLACTLHLHCICLQKHMFVSHRRRPAMQGLNRNRALRQN